MLIVEVVSQVAAGRRFWLYPGQKAVVGCSEFADFPLRSDRQMADRHFEIEGRPQRWQVRDLTTESGTFLNGEAIQVAELRHHDQIVAGDTTLVVHMNGESSEQADECEPVELASADESNLIEPVLFGSWTLATIPQGWTLTDAPGLCAAEPAPFPSSVVFGESAICDSFDLPGYLQLLSDYLSRESSVQRVEGPSRLEAFGERQLVELVVVHRDCAGVALVQRQVHTRDEQLRGEASLLTTADQFDAASEQFGSMLLASSFNS